MTSGVLDGKVLAHLLSLTIHLAGRLRRRKPMKSGARLQLVYICKAAIDGTPEESWGVNGVKGVVGTVGGTAVAGVKGDPAAVTAGGSAARTNTRRRSCALAASVRAASAISATALAHGNCCAAAFVLATIAASASDSASEHRNALDFNPACWALLQKQKNNWIYYCYLIWYSLDTSK